MNLYGYDQPERLVKSKNFRDACMIKAKAFEDGTFIIESDGITLDFAGKWMAAPRHHGPPDQRTGRAVVVRRAKNVTIKNGTIRGFKIAIYAEDAPGLTIENCDVSNNYRQHLKSTPQKEDEADWLFGHDNDLNEWLRYGAGIYLLRCDKAKIINCRARDGQNGICLVRCNDARVESCDMSFMSGWGLALWRSNRCQIIANRFDYCVRGYSHGVYARGQDSTGILVYEQCSDNVFAYNHATHGGDGFFLYAGNETVKKTGQGGCNRNLLYENDFSYAIANGIEATFSDQNIFLGNKLINCVHGIWGGYSRHTIIARNQIADCKSGISIEHGDSNEIRSNDFKNCGVGIRLWWDDNKGLLATPYAKKQECRSSHESIRQNRFRGVKTAIEANTTNALKIAWNNFDHCEKILRSTGSTSIAEMACNNLLDGRIENQSSVRIDGDKNFISPKVRVAGDVNWKDSAPAPIPASDHPSKSIWPEIEGLKMPAVTKREPVRPRQTPTAPLEKSPEGKEHIVVNEWGPAVR